MTHDRIIQAITTLKENTDTMKELGKGTDLLLEKVKAETERNKELIDKLNKEYGFSIRNQG